MLAATALLAGVGFATFGDKVTLTIQARHRNQNYGFSLQLIRIFLHQIEPPAPCPERLPPGVRHAAYRRHHGLSSAGTGLEKCVCFAYPHREVLRAYQTARADVTSHFDAYIAQSLGFERHALMRSDSMNAQDVLNRARTEGVELIRFIYCDFTGVQRGKVTTIDDLANRLSHGINLTNAQMAFTLVNTLVPIEGMSPVGELRMVPAPETFTILPWMPEHASMNCDLIQKNGERYGACPRTFLKDVIARAAARGICVQAAFEDEFYLCKQHPETGKWEPADDSGIYHETGLDYQGKFHTTITRTLRSMGMMPEMVYHEGGPGQQEISIRHEPALKAADNQMKLRNAVRGVAHTMGYRASFAPKPFPWTFGNGAHVHMSIWDMETNKNLMYDAGAEEQFSQMGRYFVGGLLKHMSALVALTCPSYNSYRRLQPRSWSTSDVVWGFDNRQAAVRAASPFWGREMATCNIEIKASDSTSNPYISLAGMIAAGLDGIDNKIDPGEPTQSDPADYSDAERRRRGIRRVPTSLREAIGEFKADVLFKDLMPELMWRAYQDVKLAECDAFEANNEEFELKAHFDVF